MFRAVTDLVTVGVTVSTRGGPVSPRLTRDEFEVREDGVPQSVSYFATGDDAETAPPLHLGLLFDTSGSMGEDIQLARTAAIKFLNTLPEAVDVTLVDFDTEVRAARFTQADFPRLVERIRSRKPQGFTAIYDALGVYLDGSANDDGRTILVVFSDGGDTRSALRFSEALTLLRASDVTVYSIGLIQNQSASAPDGTAGVVDQLAEESGGEAFFPRSMRDVENGVRGHRSADPWSVHPGVSVDQHGPRRALATRGRARAPRGAAGRGGAHASRATSPPYRSDMPCFAGRLIPCGTIMRWPDRRRPPLLPCHQVRTRSSSSATSRWPATRSAPCPSSSRG